MFSNILLLVVGIYLISIPLIFTTRNFRSALVFKVIPCLLGLPCLFIGIHKLFM